MAEMTVAQLINREPVTIGLDTRISTMCTLLKTHKFHHLLVLDGEELVGLVSDGDINRVISPWIGTVRETATDTQTLNLRAHQIMSRDLHTASADTGVTVAIARLLDENISILPIVDAENRPIGVLSWRDLLRQIIRRRPGKSAA